MKDAGSKCADAASQEHIAELADGGVGQDALDVVLQQAHRRRVDGGEGTDDGDDVQGQGRELIDGVVARDHIHARGDHRRGVDQRADRRRPLHRVGQPDVQGNLRGLARCPDKQQQCDGGDDRRAHRKMAAGKRRGKFREFDGSESAHSQENAQQEAGIADAINDKGFLSGVGG